MIRAPVSTTLLLARDPASRAHISFVTLAVSFSILVNMVFSIEQDINSALLAAMKSQTNNPSIGRYFDLLEQYQKTILALSMYYNIALMLVANYLVLKFMRPRLTVRLSNYLKLFCLASGFMVVVASIISIPDSIVFQSDVGEFIQALESSSFVEAVRADVLNTIGLAIWGVVGALLAIYHVRLQVRYWGLPRWRVIASLPLVGLLAFALDQAIDYLASMASGGIMLAQWVGTPGNTDAVIPFWKLAVISVSGAAVGLILALVLRRTVKDIALDVLVGAIGGLACGLTVLFLSALLRAFGSLQLSASFDPWPWSIAASLVGSFLVIGAFRLIATALFSAERQAPP